MTRRSPSRSLLVESRSPSNLMVCPLHQQTSVPNSSNTNWTLPKINRSTLRSSTRATNATSEPVVRSLVTAGTSLPSISARLTPTSVTPWTWWTLRRAASPLPIRVRLGTLSRSRLMRIISIPMDLGRSALFRFVPVWGDGWSMEGAKLECSGSGSLLGGYMYISTVYYMQPILYMR